MENFEVTTISCRYRTVTGRASQTSKQLSKHCYRYSVVERKARQYPQDIPLAKSRSWWRRSLIFALRLRIALSLAIRVYVRISTRGARRCHDTVALYDVVTNAAVDKAPLLGSLPWISSYFTRTTLFKLETLTATSKNRTWLKMSKRKLESTINSFRYRSVGFVLISNLGAFVQSY